MKYVLNTLLGLGIVIIVGALIGLFYYGAPYSLAIIFVPLALMVLYLLGTAVKTVIDNFRKPN